MQSLKLVIISLVFIIGWWALCGEESSCFWWDHWGGDSSSFWVKAVWNQSIGLFARKSTFQGKYCDFCIQILQRHIRLSIYFFFVCSKKIILLFILKQFFAIKTQCRKQSLSDYQTVHSCPFVELSTTVGIWNPVAQPFEIWTNGRSFVKNHFKSRQKCPDFEWLSSQLAIHMMQL